MPDPLPSPLWEGLRYLPSFVLLWLAFFFGRTLRRGHTPLIEQVARRSSPALPAALCRYTRRLTGIWCVYFVVAALAAAWANAAGTGSYGRVSAAIWAGTALLFVGERWLRPLIFPNEVFPGLLQQLRDTWSIWHPQRGSR